MSRRTLIVAAILCVAGYVFVYAAGRANPPVRSDGYSYYVYLPAWLIYGDPSLSSVARDCCGGEFPPHTAIIRWPGTRRWVNAHPIGVAVLQAPFFVAGHALTKWSNLSADGFTLYYQHAAGLAGVFWTIAGLFVIRGLLVRHFSDRVTAATLLILVFGTGLYHYATYDSSYSHVYSFFLFASLLYLTEAWWALPATRRSVLLGLVCGLIILTRHTNVLLLVVVPLYGVVSAQSAVSRLRALKDRWRPLGLVAAVGAIVIAPQLAIYHEATGRLLVSSYGDLTFNFRSPHLWGVLFSVQKGLFFWSPILLAAVAGFFVGHGATRAYALGAAIVMLLDTYLVASWWDWQFGASYNSGDAGDLLVSISNAPILEWRAADVRSHVGAVPRRVPEVAVMIRRLLTAVAIVGSLCAVLAYLRDPPWLAHIESGLRGWERSTDGTPYRWTDGHASFFVAATATRITIPIRATFDSPGDPPVLVSVSIDDRAADAFVLRDDRWELRKLPLPPPGRRTLRRIDVRVDRVRAGNRGVQLGPLTTDQKDAEQNRKQTTR
jgi:hypothetical protein